MIKFLMMWIFVGFGVGVATLYASSQVGDVLFPDEVMRFVLFWGAVVGCGLFAGMLWKHPERRYYIAPISWMVNLGLFYLFRIINYPVDIYLLNDWSRLLHLHALILLIGGLLINDSK